jgi:hypothetical protein
VVQAAETGDVRGKVEDGDGLGVPGVTLALTGANIAGELHATSGPDGTFRFVSVPPGGHELTVRREGFAPARYAVAVRLDEVTFVPVTLQVAATAAEEIVVEEARPVIDASRSITSTAMSDELIQSLPVGRSFQDVTAMAPGVYGRVDTQDGGPSNGNPSVRGEGQYGNNYLVDGISTRDPATKTFGSDVNFDAIEEVQVYTDGLPAEYGEATGMLVNVVTKDGGDEHHGSAGYLAHFDAAAGTYDVLDITQGEEIATDKRDFFLHELSLTAGGPIVREKLWYFFGADLYSDHTHFEANQGLPTDILGGQAFGKLTWFVTPALTAQYQASWAQSHTENDETSGLFAPEAQSLRDSRDLINTLTLRWRPGAANELELKGSAFNSFIALAPMSGEGETPAMRDLATGQYVDNFTQFDDNKRARLGGSLKYTQLVEDFLGDHRFKTGLEAWRLTEARRLVFTGPEGGYEYWRYGEDYPCTAESGYADCYGYYEYSSIADYLGHAGLTMGAFLQDDWQPVEPLTLNLGFRLDRQAMYQNEGKKIVDFWMPAPRLGAAWDITGDNKTVLSVNAGRYYDINNTDFIQWADSKSQAVFKLYETDGAGGYDLVWEQGPESNPLIFCTDESLALVEDSGDRKAAEEACAQLGMLRPYHLDRLVVGLRRELIPQLAVGVKGILSATRDLAEDVNWDDYLWLATNPEEKRRDYRAVELTVEKPFDGVWQLLASYTLSESKGTTPGQFEIATGSGWGSNGNDIGVYADDVNDPATRQSYFEGGWGDYLQAWSGLGRSGDDAGWYGYLPYHSFHQVKLAGSYTAPWGSTLGAVYEFDSGHAWQRRGYVEMYGDYNAFPEGRGTRFMPPVHYLDLRVAHTFGLGGARSLELAVDAFNVLDLQTPITYYENDNELFGAVLYRQSPRSLRAGVKMVY